MGSNEARHSGRSALPRKPKTVRAYTRALTDFAAFLGLATHVEAMSLLLSLPHEGANSRVAQYRANLVARGKSPASVNFNLDAIRSLVNDAHRSGLVEWTLDVARVPGRPVHDTRGPGQGAYRKMIEASSGADPKSRRDAAILRLLHDCALRRERVRRLDMADIDIQGERIQITTGVVAKGNWITVPAAAWQALVRWVEARGDAAGPVFRNFSRNPNIRSGRMSGEGIRSCVKRYGTLAARGFSPQFPTYPLESFDPSR